MKKNSFRVAIVTESLWGMGGANRVLDVFAEMFPSADIYSLFGKRDSLSKNILKHKIYFSCLNRIPFVRKIYRYLYLLWFPVIEAMDFSKYDLVISSSSRVAHGIVVPLDTFHLGYIHTPMRDAWDLSGMYMDTKGWGLRKNIVNMFLPKIRMWDVCAGQRPDALICNSRFVRRRIEKYWGRKDSRVIYPPVEMYKGKINTKRDSYAVCIAPFEPNKKGDFLLECASKLGFELKIVGKGDMYRGLKRRYKRYSNISFLCDVDEKEKWKVLSDASCYIMPGIEDFGIAPLEAMSCGTPVLAYNAGGITENLVDGVNGYFFDSWDIDSFRIGMEKIQRKNWDYVGISKSVKNVNTRESFERKIHDVLVEYGLGF